MADRGTISPEDLELFQYVDTPEEGFRVLREHLEHHHLQLPVVDLDEEEPEIARTRGLRVAPLE